MTPEVAAIVRQMPEGAISNPIRVPGGFVIGKLRGKRTAGRDIATMLTVRQAIFPFEGQVNPVAPTAQQMCVRSRAPSACPTARSCEALDLAGSAGARVNDPGQVRLDAVTPPELRDLLANLPIGQPSQPIIAPDGAGAGGLRAETRNLAEVTAADQARDQIVRERVELISRWC